MMFVMMGNVLYIARIKDHLHSYYVLCMYLAPLLWESMIEPGDLYCEIQRYLCMQDI
jgi:hypothetical protein